MVIKIDKKAMDPSSTITALVIFVVILAVILIIAFYFSSSTKGSGIFKYATDWVGGFKW